MAIMEIERKRNFELIKAMHTVVMTLNDDDAIDPWFYSYPDGSDDGELMEIAGDSEMMDDLCSNFRRRMAQGSSGGWFTQPYHEFSESFERRSQGLPEHSHVYGAKEE